ncbi:MAG: hypothetical protein H6834_10440 [Planctomycetes bacterium]|nr:hypothetical protein [Planctomycetota bacterium]
MTRSHPGLVGLLVWCVLLGGAYGVGLWAFESPLRLTSNLRPSPHVEATRETHEEKPSRIAFTADQRTPRQRAEWARRGPAGLPLGQFLADDAPAFTEAETMLGAALFRSRALSLDGKTACADCHPPVWNFRAPSGRGGPTPLLNLAYLAPYVGKRGFERLATKASHAWTEHPNLIDRLRDLAPELFDGLREIQGEDPTTVTVAKSIATFLALNRSAPFDEDWSPSIARSIARGRSLFEGRGGCSSCHTPPLYTTRTSDAEPSSVPTLLGDLEARPPYLHGHANTLEQLLEHHEVPAPPWDLEARGDLLAFLRSLRGSLPSFGQAVASTDAK